MFCRNLQKLGHLLVPHFTVNSSSQVKSFRSIGRVCLILLPVKNLQLSIVHCYSTKSQKNSLNKSEVSNKR